MGQAYTEALARKHARIASEIEQEEQRPHPDDVRLHALKKQKLRLKDEMLVRD